MHGPIHYDSRWNGDHGIGRFSAELAARLPGVRVLRIIGPKLSIFDPLAVTAAVWPLREGIFLSPGFNPPLASRIPFVFSIHDLTHLKVPEESTAVRRLYYKLVVRPRAQKAWRVLTVSEFSRREIVEWADIPEERVHVVGSGVSDAYRKVRRSGMGSYLLHVGRRGGNKNIARLVAAYALSHARREFPLLFTGMPDAGTVQHAALHGVSSRIRFAGNVNDDELAHLYRDARALVFPSLREGFGLPIVEAMACGAPVITADVTSTPEVAGPGNAILVDPLDISAMADAIDRICSDDALATELSAKGLKRSEAFSWDTVARRALRALQ